MVVKFTPTVIKFIPFGTRRLVCMSAKFGTLGGMLIGITVVKFNIVGAFSLVSVSAEFGTWGGMLIGYCR